MPADPSRAVFLSYASQDAEAARRICDALRSGGVDVWFDADGGLEHGDEWDAKIRKQIKDCVLFIPLISANTQARHEGYFRIEWELAAQRALGIASGVPFILPVVIDDTRQPEALVPDRFQMVQWTKLPGGVVTPEVKARYLKLWSHRIGAVKVSESGVGASAPAISTEAGGTTVLPKRRVPVAAWWAIAGVTLLIVAFVAWKFRPRAGGDAARDPDLQRAAALFDFNSPDSTAEGYALAEDILKSVLAKRPADPDAVILYAWLNDLFMIRGFDNSEERRALARQYAERAVKLAPRNADAIAAQALSYGDVDSSREEKLLREAIAINPRDPRYYRMLSITLVMLGKRDEALRNARQALELFPRECLVHYDYGLTQLYLGETEGAERAFRESLAVTPPDSLLYAGTHADLASFAAFLHADLGLMKSWLDRMPAQHRDHDRELMPRFIYANASGEIEDALAALRGVPRPWLRNYGEFPKALLVGDLLLQQGQADPARVQFEAAHAEVTQARARDPGKLLYRQLEVWTLLRLGRTAEAREALHRVIEATTDTLFDPLYAGEYWYGPLAASLVLGDKEAAGKYLRKAATSPPWRAYFRNLMRIDPRVKDSRSDPAIVALLQDAPEKGAAPAPSADPKSIAVLAFENLSNEKANEYFSDGISEELLNVLAKVPGLKVTARTSAFYFKGKNLPIPEIGRQLGVAYVVEGSVQRVGDNVRITAQLIKAADGFHVWSERFDRELKNVFALQDEIAGLVAGQLSLKLDLRSAAATATVNPQALEYYLQAVQRMRLRDTVFSNSEQIEELLNRALALEPKFARAQALLAEIWPARVSGQSNAITRFGQRNSPEWERIGAKARQAIALDPGSAEAHTALALGMWLGWNRAGAESEVRTALALNPSYTSGQRLLGLVAMDDGRMDDAIAALKLATQLDPFSQASIESYARALHVAGRYTEAIATYDRALALADSRLASEHKAYALAQLGQKEAAVALARTFPRESDRFRTFAAAGYRAEAEPLMPKEPENRAYYLFLLGRTEEAIAALNPNEMPSTYLHDLLFEAWYDPARNDPRFKKFLETLGVTAAHARAQTWRAAHPAEKAEAKK